MQFKNKIQARELLPNISETESYDQNAKEYRYAKDDAFRFESLIASEFRAAELFSVLFNNGRWDYCHEIPFLLNKSNYSYYVL